MFDSVYQWFHIIWKWICPPRASQPIETTIVDWGTGDGFPPAQQVVYLRSNHTSDPNIIQTEGNVYASSSTGAVVWDVPSDFEFDI